MRSNRSISWLGRFIAATCTAAATNFADIFSQTMKAANASGTHVVDGYEITVCYFGPPLSFYLRFLVFGALLFATIGILKQTFPRRVMVVVCLIGGLIVYLYWWMRSYQIFRNFVELDIDFLNNAEIKQIAYLYEGGWLDVGVAISIVVLLVLSLDRLINGSKTHSTHADASQPTW
jgi:hypothetical protein